MNGLKLIFVISNAPSLIERCVWCSSFRNIMCLVYLTALYVKMSAIKICVFLLRWSIKIGFLYSSLCISFLIIRLPIFTQIYANCLLFFSKFKPQFLELKINHIIFDTCKNKFEKIYKSNCRISLVVWPLRCVDNGCRNWGLPYSR